LRAKPFFGIIVLVCGVFITTAWQLSSETQSASKSTGTKSAAKAAAFPRVWKSLSSGKEYRVKVEGDLFTAEWVNIPPDAARQGRYIRTECRRSASRWIGTSRLLLGCQLPNGNMKLCPLILRFEVDFISPDRITGGGENLKDFDCSSCEIRKTGWGPFTWTPKKQ